MRGRPIVTLDDRMVRELRAEAAQHGDELAVAICDIALGVDAALKGLRYSRTEARVLAADMVTESLAVVDDDGIPWLVVADVPGEEPIATYSDGRCVGGVS